MINTNLQTKLQRCATCLRNRAAGTDGFTLVELLVVILILGILIAIALPTFLGQSDSAKDTNAKSALNTSYKVAATIGRKGNGDFEGKAALVADINQSEPELNAATIGSASDAAKGVVGVASSSGGDLAMAIVSDSGHLCTLVVTNHATNGPTGGSTVVAVGGSGGTGGGSGNSCPSPGSSGGATPAVLLTSTDNCGNTNILALSGSSTSLIAQTSGALGVPQFLSSGKVYFVSTRSSDSGSLLSMNSQSGSVSQVGPGSAYCGGSGLSWTSHSVTSFGAGHPNDIAYFCSNIGGGQWTSNFDGSNANDQSYLFAHLVYSDHAQLTGFSGLTASNGDELIAISTDNARDSLGSYVNVDQGSGVFRVGAISGPSEDVSTRSFDSSSQKFTSGLVGAIMPDGQNSFQLIYVNANRQANALTNVPSGTNVSDPQLSSDGGTVYFLETSASGTDAFSVSTSGGAITRLTTSGDITGIFVS